MTNQGIIPMPADFLGRYAQSLDMMSWMPDEYKVVSGYVTLSAMIQRKLEIHRGRRTIRPNLYVLFIGSPGTGKTYAIRDCCADMLRELKINVSDSPDITPEGLYKYLSDTTPCNLFLWTDETGTLFKSADYQKGIVEVLSFLYDCTGDRIQRRLSTRTLNIFKPYITLALGIQPERFITLIDAGSVSQGLLSRVLMVPGVAQPRIAEHPEAWGAWKATMSAATTIKNWVDALPDQLVIQCGLLPDKMIRAYSEHVEKEEEGNEWWNRVDDFLYRLAILNCVNRRVLDTTLTSDAESREVYKGSVVSGVPPSLIHSYIVSILSMDVNAVNRCQFIADLAYLTPEPVTHHPRINALGTPPLTVDSDPQKPGVASPMAISRDDAYLAILLVEWLRPKINLHMSTVMGSPMARRRNRVIDAVKRIIASSKAIRHNGRKYIPYREIYRRSGTTMRETDEYVTYLQSFQKLGKKEKIGSEDKTMLEVISDDFSDIM